MATAQGIDLQDNDSKLNGELGTVSLNDILQMMGMAKRTGTIRVNYQGREGKIYLKDGEVLHAATGSVIGEDALARLMRWTDAKFAIEEGIDDAPATIAKSADAAMLDLLRRMDEGEDPGVLFTPFPPLDRPDLSELARKVRQSKLRPQTRPSRLRRSLALGALVVVLALGGGAASLYLSLEDVTDSAALPEINVPAARAVEVPAPVLFASMASGAYGAETLVARYGVDWVTDASESRDPGPAPALAPESTPPVAPATGTARVLILVDPWALVHVDGREVGETPMPAIEIGAGAHEIVLSNPNRVGELRDTFVVEAGESRTLRYSMDETGRVSIVVTPWADVFVDGRHVGQTPMGAIELPLGTHTVVLRHPDLGEKSETVEIRAGQSVSIKVEM